MRKTPDNSTTGRMKDAYAIAIFSWKTLITLLRNNRYDAAYYVYPFVLLGEAIRNENLNIDDRIEMLSQAFNFFLYTLKVVEKNKSNKFFPPKYRSPAIGTLFADQQFLYRLKHMCRTCYWI